MEYFVPFFFLIVFFLFVFLQASTDQSAVDTDIPYEIGSFAFNVITLLGIIAVMSQLAWQVFIVFVPVIALSIWYQVLFFGPSRLYIPFFVVANLTPFYNIIRRCLTTLELVICSNIIYQQAVNCHV
jgi:hypothetical protein